MSDQIDEVIRSFDEVSVSLEDDLPNLVGDEEEPGPASITQESHIDSPSTG
jgi:hypothetical protein